MLSTEFRQSNIDLNPAELLAQHKAAASNESYWDEVERDLSEHAEIWALPDYEELA